MWTTDFWLGAVWTLIATALGFVIGVVVAVLLTDRPDAGGGAPEEPEPDPWEGLGVMDDDEADRWLREHTLAEPVQLNLVDRRLGGERGESA